MLPRDHNCYVSPREIYKLLSSGCAIIKRRNVKSRNVFKCINVAIVSQVISNILKDR